MLSLRIVTPERKVLDSECDEVSLPGSLGYFGVLPGHAALLASLGTGELSYRSGSKVGWVALQGGFCEVSEDLVNVLADVAELPPEIDVAAAKTAHAAAEERMKTAAESEFDAAKASAELNAARINVAARA